MATQQQFIDFLSEIEPSPTTKSVCSSAHSTLRGKLEQHETYKDIHVNTYPRESPGACDLIALVVHRNNRIASMRA